jgi:hypothetical protein
MYRIFAVILLTGLLFAVGINSEPTQPIKGSIASLNNLIMGGSGDVNKAQAEALADKGQPIVFITGSGRSATVYFVFNQDGSFAGKKLAKYANNKNIGIVGKTKRVRGINIIIAEMIESMD